MRRTQITAFAISSAFSLAACAQMHKVAQPEDVVRAVGVYEWIGERTKPTANRLIPITLFIDGDLQDAGVYLARPVPFALDRGTIYEIDHAGVSEGTLSLAYSSHLQSANVAENYDEGWFGYGTFAPPPVPKKTVALKESKAPAAIVSSKPDTAKPDADRPTLGRKADQASAKTPAPQSTSTDAAPASPADDPDRPHLIRKPGSDTVQDGDPDKTDDKISTKASTTSGTPANDPDRPTLKKRSPEEAKKAKREAEQSSATGLATSLNDDPNRPTLHHGTGQQALTENDLPKLKGVPADLHQAIAVSDAKTRPEHDFSRPWADDAERVSILAKMQALASAQIAAYKSANPVPGKPTAVAVTKPSARATANSKLRHAKTAESLQPHEALFDEKLNGYTLSYGGAATYVYTARTDGEAASLIYVTIVAQVDALGGLQPAMQSVTDAVHLDRTPWMRLIDVVDVDASNRASLLFELRGETSRQFALYRVIAARSEQVFLTGTTQ